MTAPYTDLAVATEAVVRLARRVVAQQDRIAKLEIALGWAADLFARCAGSQEPCLTCEGKFQLPYIVNGRPSFMVRCPDCRTGKRDTAPTASELRRAEEQLRALVAQKESE